MDATKFVFKASSSRAVAQNHDADVLIRTCAGAQWPDMDTSETIFPPLLAVFVQAHATRLGSCRLAVAVPLLGFIGVFCNGSKVCLDKKSGWRQPMTLYQLSVMPSGSGKVRSALASCAYMPAVHMCLLTGARAVQRVRWWWCLMHDAWPDGMDTGLVRVSVCRVSRSVSSVTWWLPSTSASATISSVKCRTAPNMRSKRSWTSWTRILETAEATGTKRCAPAVQQLRL